MPGEELSDNHPTILALQDSGVCAEEAEGDVKAAARIKAAVKQKQK